MGDNYNGRWTTQDELRFVEGLGRHSRRQPWESRQERGSERRQRLLRAYLAVRTVPLLDVDAAAAREAALERLRDFEQGA